MRVKTMKMISVKDLAKIALFRQSCLKDYNLIKILKFDNSCHNI